MVTKPVTSDAPADERFPLRRLLYEMVRIRRFEEKCAELYSAAKIRGFLHLYIGQEAIAVGVMDALKPDDVVVATYREHGHALARGISMDAIMAEMYGKRSGCSRGRGGSMHLFDAATNFIGGNAIVGGGLPLAVGAALAEQLQGRTSVTACFFGEGAVAEGAFHESMNLAALWKLPVLFVCENNLYAMGTALRRSHAQPDIAMRAASYGMPAEAVDGMDLVAVHEAAQRAVQHVRAGAGPYLIEFRTYRYRAHSMYDPELYRPREEVEQWKQHDPLTTVVDRLMMEQQLNDAELQEIEAQVEVEIAQAIAFAEGAPWEPVEDLTRFVYAEEVLS